MRGIFSARACDPPSTGCPAISLFFSGTTRITLSFEATMVPLLRIISRRNLRLPGGKGFSGRNTHSPRLFAITLPISASPSRILTVLPGAARPAMTVSPLELMRTTSNDGGRGCSRKLSGAESGVALLLTGSGIGTDSSRSMA